MSVTPQPVATTHGLRAMWLIAAATATLMVTMGIRQSLGLFVQPIHAGTGLTIVQISFALAIAQLAWGAAQPVFGAWADKRGPGRVLAFGGVLLVIGMALAPFLTSQWGLVLTLGLLSAAGAGAGSFSVLIGAVAQRIEERNRSMAAGVINAGGSFGQFVFAPFAQAMISTAGWAVAMWAMAVAALATLPLAWPLRRRRVVSSPVAQTTDAPTPADPNTGISLGEQLRIAFRDRSYWLLHAGFFTCGFHIAFLVTHLPTEIALCGLSDKVSATALALIGLFNVAGSLAIGWLGQRYRMKSLLALMYTSRVVLIGLYLLLPPTPMVFYGFAAGLGLTWLATVPPTAGIIGKLFGARYLATLFGFTLLSHQIGGFFGAWLGGLALDRLGDYSWMWYADMALAALAAVANLPIREAKPLRAPRMATA